MRYSVGMRKILATAAAWVAARRRPREMPNVEQRCADIARFAAAARRS